jgi:hypothetical protein
MTIRETLSLRKRRFVIFSYVGMAIFVPAMILTQEFEPIIIIGIGGFVLAFVSLFILFFNTPCPKCKGNLGRTIIHIGGPFSVPNKIKYCPFCGVNLDSSVAQPVVQADAGHGTVDSA